MKNTQKYLTWILRPIETAVFNFHVISRMPEIDENYVQNQLPGGVLWKKCYKKFC